MNKWSIPIVGMVLVVATGCQSTYYGAMEQMGWHKRDLLVARVKDAREGQEDAKEQFANALEQFSSVVQFDGGDLEQEYNRLNNELERSEARAQAVHDRVDAVEDVAKALFKEWRQELNQYSNPELKRASEQQLRDTERQYDQLINAMRRVESRMEPVLKPMRDHVLFLKHNLNARAIASIQNELDSLEVDVNALIRDMERAIAEADAFIEAMDGA